MSGSRRGETTSLANDVCEECRIRRLRDGIIGRTVTTFGKPKVEHEEKEQGEDLMDVSVNILSRGVYFITQFTLT